MELEIEQAKKAMDEELELASADLFLVYACDCGCQDWKRNEIATEAAHHARRYLLLRHLIAEARRVERVRQWSATKRKLGECLLDGYELAQEHVQAILSAPDAETKKLFMGVSFK